MFEPALPSPAARKAASRCDILPPMEPQADFARRLAVHAAKEIRQRIRQDRDRVSVRLRPVLDDVDKRLLEIGLSVNSLMQGREVNAHTLAKGFTEELGRSPWAYVTDRRMEAAARLLLGSDLKVWLIATNVGYDGRDSFSRAFGKWSGGQSPKEFRQQAADRAPGELVAAALGDEIERLEAVARGISGAADREEAAVTLRQLQATEARIYLNYWTLDPPTPEQEEAEQVVARSVWRAFEELSPAGRRAAVESQSGCRTSAFFHQLCARSYELAAEDPERGLEIARLAPVALDGLAPQIDEPLLLSYRARASVVLAYALERTGDPEGAAAAYAAGEEALAAAGDGVYLPVVSELNIKKALFLISQDKLREAGGPLRIGIDTSREVAERLRLELSGQPPGA